MRNAFAAEITALAAEDPRLVLLSGDIGNRLFDRFKDVAPERFFNCGVAEANMITVGAGMALSGMRPVAYTIAPFITARCLEQIRVDLCYHHAPVIIVGVGAGLSYAANGPTHHACEDLAQLRTLPGMSVLCPADPLETHAALRAALAHEGPTYIRLGKKGEPSIHPDVPSLAYGKVLPLRAGDDVCLVATGTVLPLALEAADRLAARGLSAAVVSCPSVKPLDEAFLTEAFARYRVVATVEEHSRMGGLGGAVAEWRCDQDAPRAALVRIGTADHFLHEAGEQEHARSHYGLTPEAIAQRLVARLDRITND